MSATPSNAPLPSLNELGDQLELFRPPWMFRNGHIQTLAGTYVFGHGPKRYRLPAATSTLGEVSIGDGDRLVYHDDCPPTWRAGDPIALLLHGLAGSHLSPYMGRIAAQLYRQNIRAIRLNWRGCGTGMLLARYPYHSGRSEDLLATIDTLHDRFPSSPITVIGFSMGGKVALKLLGEAGAVGNGTAGIARAVAVCPPIDLSVTIEYISTGWARVYDAYFAKTCVRNVRSRQQVRPDAIVPEGWFAQPPRCMREFDESFTAPVCGFASASDYYAKCSARPFLPTISVPTLIIAAQDDPVIPFGPFADATLSPTTQLRAPKHGGHLGFITHAGPCWLDQQIVNWTMGRD